jgi:IS30 family transposase
MSYVQLTLEEREVISQMRFSGAGPTAIARRLNRSPSTISRELARNSDRQGYRAVAAQERTQRRRRERLVARKMDDPLINESVRAGLASEWSPEQIAGRLKHEHPRQPERWVSHQTIYRWLETCEYREHFRSFLRHGRYRKRRGLDGRGRIRNRVSIDQRPGKVDSRRRFGDWEGDTVHGAGHSGMIMTCVERKSGFLITAKMKDGTSRRLNAAKERAFRIIPPELRQTLTVDNGKEFAGHEQLSERLQIAIYFAHAYSSNERATNENTNGLLRQYFPKKTDFRDISHHALAHVTARLNNRPRKRLNYLTPLEALNKAGFALQM